MIVGNALCCVTDHSIFPNSRLVLLDEESKDSVELAHKTLNCERVAHPQETVFTTKKIRVIMFANIGNTSDCDDSKGYGAGGQENNFFNCITNTLVKKLIQFRKQHQTLDVGSRSGIIVLSG